MCLFPVVEIFWNEHQNDLMTQLKHADNKLLLIGDGRSDSPGHCAKYGTYTLIEQGLSKVVDIQLVQVCNNNFFYVISYKWTLTLQDGGERTPVARFVHDVPHFFVKRYNIGISLALNVNWKEMRTGSQLIYTFAMVTTQVLAVCMQLP